MMFTRLRLTNFTAFEHLDLKFLPGINVFVGANGTGKTHILKLLYCFLAINDKEMHLPPIDMFLRKLVDVFRPDQSQMGHLVRRKLKIDESTIIPSWNDKQAVITLERNDYGRGKIDGWPWSPSSPVFIPVKEPLSFATGFISLYDQYETSFEEVYYHIIKKALLPRRKDLSEKYRVISDIILKVMGGEVTVKGEAFYLRHQQEDMEIFLVAEGLRKLALLWQLIRNGSIQEGSTLFWDEPEANLNPSMMQHVAKALIMLSDLGVQVFLATHNYAFLKELDYQKENTPVTYFALDDSGKNGVQANSYSDYVSLSPNKIADEYLRIYDMEIQRAFKGGS